MLHALPPEIEALRAAVRSFAAGEIRPRVAVMEREQHIPRELIDQMAEVGIFGVLFPPEHGGSGLGELGFAVVQEELSRVHASTGLLVAASTGLAARLLYLFGD